MQYAGISATVSGLMGRFGSENASLFVPTHNRASVTHREEGH
jgi:hypothetical protein